MQERIARQFATFFSFLLFALLSAACLARPPSPPDPRDTALLARMTLAEKINQLMLLSKGTMTGPDSAGRPNKPAEELAREGIGFQMSAFEWSAADINRIQRIALKESRLGIPVVFATDIIHGYWTVFPVPLGMAGGIAWGRRSSSAIRARTSRSATPCARGSRRADTAAGSPRATSCPGASGARRSWTA